MFISWRPITTQTPSLKQANGKVKVNSDDVVPYNKHNWGSDSYQVWLRLTMRGLGAYNYCTVQLFITRLVAGKAEILLNFITLNLNLKPT